MTPYLVLKFTLSLLYFAFSFISLTDPQRVKSYVDIRFQGFHQFAFTHSVIASYVTRDAVRKLPMASYKLVAAFAIVGGLAVLVEHRPAILVFAYILMAVGGALHMPYATQQLRTHIASQIKRLLLVFAVFCGMLMIARSSSEEQMVANSI
eukprot:TRINITY_DN9872_c0_g4_i1.p1 TRINITY_DN9872_c0_g4~~TRINITY_DN9872_c0_g4_i1.p1  ORF type:complete len:151 (-),score=37.41 TRINITY_DN9872_c0_g4_i1:108-560(-)